MKTIIVALALLTSSSFATAATLKVNGPSVTADFAKDALPPCGHPMAIFNGSSFDGTVYLHDADIALDSVTTKHVRDLAKDGQLPAICQVQGVPFVVVASAR